MTLPAARPHRQCKPRQYPPPGDTGNADPSRPAPSDPRKTRKKSPEIKKGRPAATGTPLKSKFFGFLSHLLLFLSFYLIDQRLKRAVKRFFEWFGGTFYEEMMLGDMNSDLRDLVFNVMNDIVQLEENIYFDNSVMECV
jgi:hypothetical protein